MKGLQRALEKRKRALKQAKCRQGNRVMCETISRGDGRAAVIQIFIIIFHHISSYISTSP